MSEAGDYDPGHWRGYDFKSARKTYDKHVSRSYSDARVSRGGKSVSVKDCVPAEVKTESTSPLVIAIDVTGSMGDWPATIFSKLPYLDLEGKEYLGEDMEISFAAVGDYFSDEYPLQVQPFCTGKGLEKTLKKLIIEQGGGGTTQESYELAATYYAHNTSMDEAVRPIFIFIGDEGFYDWVDKEASKDWAHVSGKQRVSGAVAIKNLKKKFSVYIVRKPYSMSRINSRSSTDERIHKQWVEALGEDHVVELPDASRVVDVIFGILAKETGRVDYFEGELKDRQDPDQVSVVMDSLVTVHTASVKKLPENVSLTRRKKGSKTPGKSVSLLD